MILWNIVDSHFSEMINILKVGLSCNIHTHTHTPHKYGYAGCSHFSQEFLNTVTRVH